VRTDRWYALLALLYLWARYAALDESLIRERRGKGLMTTQRLVAGFYASLSETGVTNALGQAARYGIFTREPYHHGRVRVMPRSKTSTSGRLTLEGRRALGEEVRDEWREQIGPTWDVWDRPHMAVAAVRILGAELRAERQRRQHELQVEQKRRELQAEQGRRQR
jgi:hypothetical protein